MKAFKKILSLLLAVMMVMSLVTVMATATGAVTYEDTKLYFDVDGTGWEMGAKDKVGFYIYGGNFADAPIAWGGKKTLGVSEGDGIFSFDPAAKKIDLEDGVQYKIIFTKNMGDAQSADLFFDTSCFGHCAYCNGEMIENTVDSSKKNQVALWKDLDPAKYGPVKGITSLGNLVGTCLPQGETDESLFTTWLTDTGSTGLKNAMKYTVEPGTKTAQKLVDDLAGALNLTKDFVKSAIEENQAGIDAALALDETLTKPFDWSYDDSTLPAAAAPTEPETKLPETTAPTEPETDAPTEPETTAPETEPETEPIVGQAGYYIAGTMSGWAANPDFKLTKNEDSETEEYFFKGLAITGNDQFKVAYSADGVRFQDTDWYPDGMGNNYGENGEITADGTYDVYFRPNVDGGDDWFYGCIYVDGMPAPTQPETEPETTAPETEPETTAPTEPETTAPETQPETEPETTAPETQPETEPVVEITDGYYVVGTISDWAPKAEFKMTLGEDGKYVLKGLDITATTQFKVVKVDGDNQTWLPDGMGNNYGENGEVTVPGVYDVYFDPEIASDGWFYNCINVDGMPAPETEPATEPSTEPDDGKKPIEKLPFADDVVAGAGIEDTFKVYFLMPCGSDVDWCSEYNELDGVNYAGVYWWQGSKNLDPWPGAKMTLVDAEQHIFSVNVPYEPDVLTTIIFNNAIDGGQDKTAPQYSAAHQTANLNVQGYEEGDSDTMPEGTAADNFDGCIFIIDPDTLDVNKFSGKDTIDGNWYVYYGNGCYGKYAEDSESFTTVEDMCCNPAHNHGGVKPTEPETQPETQPVTEPVVQGDFYVVGNMTGWAPQEEYKMTEGENGIYTYEMELTTASQFKVVYVEGDKQTWLPDGMGNNYGENGEITADGTYTIYFDPEIASDGWFYNCIKAELKSQPETQPETQPAETLLGDIDGDGDVTVLDATFVQRYATKINVPFTDEQMMLGDVDGDGDVTVVDATFIQRYATKVQVPYPIGEPVNG